jgi:hypothetical protein
MTPTEKSEFQKAYAEYLKKSVEQLSEAEIPTEFREPRVKVTVVTVRDYCVRIIRENKEPDKIQIIKDFYSINGELTASSKLPLGKLLEMTAVDKLVYQLEQAQNVARPVANLFSGGIEQSTARTLDFAAFLFNLKNIAEFKKWQETEITKNTTKKATESTNIDNDLTTEKVENDLGTMPKQTFFQKHKYKFTIAASIILLLVCSAYAYNLKSYVDENKEKLATIEQISFKPIIADSGLVENITKPNVANQSIANQVVTKNSKQIIANVEILEMPLSFYTNNIYNGKFLFTTDKWDFETDMTGEDMNSKYGEPYRSQLKSLQKLPNTQPTIANKSIWIRFNVMNKSNTKLYVDNIKLEKVATHKINNKIVKWSNWITPKDGEKRFELALSHEPQIAAIVPFADIAANSPQHFSLIINCDKTCENYIYKFKLIVSANDGQGNRYNVSSDRVYMLGLVSEL